MPLTQVSECVGSEIAREQQHGKERQNAQKSFAMRHLHSLDEYVKSDASQPTRRRQLKEGSDLGARNGPARYVVVPGLEAELRRP